MALSKDADMSPFEAGRKLLDLNSQKLSLNDRIDLVFQDADLVPLLVQVWCSLSSEQKPFFCIKNSATSTRLSGVQNDVCMCDGLVCMRRRTM